MFLLRFLISRLRVCCSINTTRNKKHQARNIEAPGTHHKVFPQKRSTQWQARTPPPPRRRPTKSRPRRSAPTQWTRSWLSTTATAMATSTWPSACTGGTPTPPAPHKRAAPDCPNLSLASVSAVKTPHRATAPLCRVRSIVQDVLAQQSMNKVLRKMIWVLVLIVVLTLFAMFGVSLAAGEALKNSKVEGSVMQSLDGKTMQVDTIETVKTLWDTGSTSTNALAKMKSITFYMDLTTDPATQAWVDATFKARAATPSPFPHPGRATERSLRVLRPPLPASYLEFASSPPPPKRACAPGPHVCVSRLCEPSHPRLPARRLPVPTRRQPTWPTSRRSRARR